MTFKRKLIAIKLNEKKTSIMIVIKLLDEPPKPCKLQVLSQ